MTDRELEILNREDKEMTTEQQRIVHGEWITACLDSPKKKLTKWELDFVESLMEQHSSGHYLSARQAEILEYIYVEKT